jgi:4'-phosphopantetheinyl transferase EntD
VKVLELEHAFGRLVILSFGDSSLDEAPLVREERSFAEQFGVPRRRTWIAGRAALRRGLDHLGVSSGPILGDERGAPVLPDGVVGSVSHKNEVAVALVARSQGGARVGVDVEVERPFVVDIAKRVLTKDEISCLAGLDARSRDMHVRMSFCAKEAIYKAIDPFVKRYVGFKEVALRGLDLDAPVWSVGVELDLEPAAPIALNVEATCSRMSGADGEALVVSAARARPS